MLGRPKFQALSFFIVLALSLAIPSAGRADLTAATAINFFWDTPAGKQNKVGTWLIREAEITAVGDASYFAIIGNWTPPFYIGVQELSYRTGKAERVALFSAWDTYTDNYCTTCSPESRSDKGSLTRIKELGTGVVPGVFGYEGTGVNSWMNDFTWSVGDRIRAVINLRPVTNGTEISAALQKNEEPWRYFATYVYSKSYSSLESGYSFIEDFGGRPYTVRSAEFRSSWGESERLDEIVRLTRVGGQRNETTSQINPNHRIEQRSKSGIWGEVGNTSGDVNRIWRSHSVEIDESSLIPIEARIAALNLTGTKASEYKAQYQNDATRILELRSLEKIQTPKGSGVLRIGETLSVEIPKLESGILSYQWRRNGEQIQGATNPRYLLKSEDLGAFIQVAVTVNLSVSARTLVFDFPGFVEKITQEATKFKNCAALNKVYSGGVAKSSSSVNKGGKIKQKPTVNAKVYDLNKSLDRDKDGLACER
jgi:hypothetical protein